MATTPRTPTSRTQHSVRRIYETVQPRSEMKETPEAFLLHLYLPGFTKERVKITFAGSTRMVRITGERPVQGNRWSRFDQSYPVPENCEAETLQGRFELGTLVLTMPKKFNKNPQDEAPKPEQRDTGEGRPENVEEPLIGDKKTASSLIPTPVQEVPSDMKARKPTTQDDTSSEKISKASMPPEAIRDRSARAVKRPAVAGKASKGPEKVEHPKPAVARGEVAAEEEKRQEDRLKAKLAAVKKQLEGKRAEDADHGKKQVREEEQEDVGNRPVFKEKEIRTRKVLPKEEAAEPSSNNNNNNKNQDMNEIVGNGMREVVRRIAQGKWKEEEKDLVVNMGAAVLVIAALGAYVSYRFASSYP